MVSLISFAQTTIFNRPLSADRVGISTKHPPSLMFLTSTRTSASEPCIYSSAPNLHGTRRCCLRSLAFCGVGIGSCLGQSCGIPNVLCRVDALHPHLTRSGRACVTHPAHPEASFVVLVAHGDDLSRLKCTLDTIQQSS